MDIAFKMLISYVSKQSGIDLNQYRESYLKRRIELRMKATGNKTFEEYLSFLRKNGKKEIEELINTIAINVTEFMRDVTPFKFFMERILPDIANRKHKVKSNMLRFWSAGCSNGEEPYSIAICIYESLGSDWLFTIYATDIDLDSLEKAKEGYYDASQLKNLNKTLLYKYFEKEDDGYRVKSFLKRHIRFKRHDLTTDTPVSKYLDGIFCRNVIIYFNDSQKSKIFNDFYNALVNRGYLIIGKSETLPSEFNDKFKCINLKDKVYQKT
ncbi:CheR family methyltransferase [Geoglobus acetivorans]|uniref:protein-glutamate O-methyltransferase n=1 Tax=Geoglobus acetivorans TaxID=565033 RepID=A0A0A7GCZ0_GEOAI|nr:Chemotaxis protein methyltransferase CheR [Geoglobus acetivorans]